MSKTYQAKYIRCGKSSCRSCPHGPYWYAYWKESGKTKCEYVGKVDPRNPKDDEEVRGCEDDSILDKRKASSSLAFKILGFSSAVSEKTAKSAWRALVLENHPDRFGDERKLIRVNAAWSYLKSLYGWK